VLYVFCLFCLSFLHHEPTLLSYRASRRAMRCSLPRFKKLPRFVTRESSKCMLHHHLSTHCVTPAFNFNAGNVMYRSPVTAQLHVP